jgi:hypothetical protein
METDLTYTELAQAYVSEARGLLAPGPAPAEAERRGIEAPRPTADQAETLAPISAQLTTAAAAQLVAEDADRRALAALSLLAKASTDLDISLRLLRAAQDEEAGRPAAVMPGENRRGAVSKELDERFDWILGVEHKAAHAMRGPVTPSPADPVLARSELAQTAGDALAMIRKRTAKTGQAAISGLIGMGAAELGQAAGIAGLNIATALGQAEKVTRLYNLFREFVMNAYDSILALLGPSIAKTAASKAVEWISEVLQGEQFEKLLETIYETKTAADDLKQRAQTSQASVEKVAGAKTALATLMERHKKQSDLTANLATGLTWLGAVPSAALPQAQVIRAALFILLAAFVILSGADYVDAPRLKLIDRVEGVCKVVQGAL